MIQTIRENAAPLSVGAIIGGVVPVLMSLNIFASKTDIMNLSLEVQRTHSWVAENYISRDDMNHRLDEIKDTLKELREDIKAYNFRR